MNAIDWKAIIFEPENYERVARRARARFAFSETFAEEAHTWVLEKLQEDDFQRLRSFAHRCSPATFLFRTTGSLLEDFSRRKFGYPRPPGWVRTRGTLYLEVWHKLHIERWLRRPLIEHLSTHGGYEREEIENAISEIFRRLPQCGQPALGTEATVEFSDAETQAASNPAPGLDDTDFYEETLLRIGAIFSDNHADSAGDGRQWLEQRHEALDRFSDTLVLSDEERVILRMLYQDGLTNTFAAFALGMTPKQLTYRRDNALAKVSRTLEQVDLDLDDLREALESHTTSP